MILAFPTATGGEKSLISEHFSKCNFFYLYDSEKKNGQTYPNKYKDLERGGGRSVAEYLIELGADVLIVRELHQGAKSAIDNRAEVYQATDESVKENIESYLQGELVRIA